MAAPQYKLTYFDVRGRGEAARLMFALAKQDFEDQRIQGGLATVKSTTPQGFLPVLETNEGKISQTTAINTYIAEKFGFMPDTAYEKAQAISVMLTLNDLTGRISSQLYMPLVYKVMPVPEDVEEKKKTLAEEINTCLAFIENLSNSGSKFIFSDKISVADIFLFTIMETQRQVLPELNSDNEWFLKSV
ncbi:hypothetical protein EB796_018016 [Bugula neritina]|uniref:HPGDS n=1 Tax=Bugula neritina TaxID=10212 RepID=A0A7J7JE70_BUGNE|nr:hypothetical protein EB796_018016 [Bugula neritina]